LAALGAALFLAGCVAYPAYPSYPAYGYGYGAPYYGGAVVGFGGGWHDGWHDHGWHDHGWHDGWHR
jgi:hypothetical protein